MDVFIQIVLIITVLLLIAQAILIYAEQKKYNRSLEAFKNIERALNICKNQLIDSQRERDWLNKQMDIIFEEIRTGKAVTHPKYKASYEYDENSPLDTRD